VNVSAPSIAGAFSNKSDAMPGVSQLVDRVGRDFGVSPDVLMDLRIALDEIVTNIVKYAYIDDAEHEFTIRCEVAGGSLATVIEDDGVAFDPLLSPMPDLSVPMEERRVGGLGVHFVKNLMNSVRYERVAGRNRLTLKQDLEQQKGHA
jgi:anti-sigma regulatory factor (Ser/Thr protein kinase)